MEGPRYRPQDSRGLPRPPEDRGSQNEDICTSLLPEARARHCHWQLCWRGMHRPRRGSPGAATCTRTLPGSVTSREHRPPLTKQRLRRCFEAGRSEEVVGTQPRRTYKGGGKELAPRLPWEEPAAEAKASRCFREPSRQSPHPPPATRKPKTDASKSCDKGVT